MEAVKTAANCKKYSGDSQKNLRYDYMLPSPTPHIHTRNELLAYLPKHAVVLEIGVHNGNFSEEILKIAQPDHLYLVDCWEKQSDEVYRDPLNKCNHDAFYNYVNLRFAANDKITIIRMYSKNAAELFQDEFFDWIYLDANHGYQAVAQDLVSWWPKIKKGGLFCGHDYERCDPNFGVHIALNEFLDQHQVQFSYLTNEDSLKSWGFYKEG